MRPRAAAELFRDALRASELEARAVEVRREIAALEAQARAAAVLARRVPDIVERGLVAVALGDKLPVTAAGDLHEEALVALVEQLLFAHLAKSVAVAATAGGAR